MNTAAGRESRAILFDFGGTLDGDGVHWPLRFHHAYVATGGNLSYSEFDPFFRISENALAARPDIRSLGFMAAIHAQAEELWEALPEKERFGVTDLAGDLHRDAVAAVKRNTPMLERLARRWRLAVVSNFTGNLDPCLEELGLLRFFEVTADSALVGIAKPDAGIFDWVLRRMELAPADTWMVGDNPESDIRPAQRLGMSTAWLAPAARPTPQGLRPTRRVERLTEIEPWLG
jgi:HAD superfamily hydrolase (TIGR01549 family)